MNVKQAELETLNNALLAKRLHILKSAAGASSGNTDFSLEPLNQSRVSLMLADANKLPSTLYELLLDINDNKDLDAAKKTAAADEVFDAFKKIVFKPVTTDTAPLEIKPFWLSRGLKSMTSDEEHDIYGMADALEYIRADFKYETRTHSGINFSAGALAFLTTLETLFVTKDLFAMPIDLKLE